MKNKEGLFIVAALIVICLCINYMYILSHELSHKRHCVIFGGKSISISNNFLYGNHVCDVSFMNPDNVIYYKMATANLESSYNMVVVVNLLFIILSFIIVK